CMGYGSGKVLRNEVMEIRNGFVKCGLYGKVRKCMEEIKCNSYRSLNLCMLHVYSKFRFIINNILLMFAEWCAVYVMVTGETGCSVTVFQEDLRDISSDIIVHRVAYVLILSLVYSLLCDLSISFGQSRQTEQTLELIFERLKASSMSDNERQYHRITGYTDINTNSYSHMHNVQVLLFNFECYCIM